MKLPDDYAICGIWERDPSFSLKVTLIFVSFGLLFHATIQYVEIDLILWRLFGLLSIIVFILIQSQVQICRIDLTTALYGSTVGALIFTSTVLTSMGIYRLFLHRLRRFPGPFWARLSKLYAVSLASKRTQYHLELEKLHQQYGDIVRTGPRELSIASPSALPFIASCQKSTFYAIPNADNCKLAFIETRDPEDHRQRRRPWEKALSTQSLTRYEPMIQNVVSTLLSLLDQYNGQVLNVTDLFSWAAYDIMGLIGFGKDFGQLRGVAEHSAMRALRNSMTPMGVFKHVPWLASFLSCIPGSSTEMAKYSNYCRRQVIEKQLIRRVGPPMDILSWVLQAYDIGDLSAPPTKEALDEEARNIIIDGAEPPSILMTCAFYFLATNLHIYKSLQQDLDRIFPGAASFKYEKIKHLPLLEGIIYETLRLMPPVPSGQPRTTPPQGLEIGDLYIPGNIDVVIPQWVVQRDERYFVHPKQFIPDRWTSAGSTAGLIKDRTAFFPFQIGPYSCMGKELAKMEVRSVIARIALNFDVFFAPGQGSKDFELSAQDTFSFTLPTLHLVFCKRIF